MSDKMQQMLNKRNQENTELSLSQDANEALRKKLTEASSKGQLIEKLCNSKRIELKSLQARIDAQQQSIKRASGIIETAASLSVYMTDGTNEKMAMIEKRNANEAMLKAKLEAMICDTEQATSTTAWVVEKRQLYVQMNELSRRRDKLIAEHQHMQPRIDEKRKKLAELTEMPIPTFFAKASSLALKLAAQREIVRDNLGKIRDLRRAAAVASAADQSQSPPQVFLAPSPPLPSGPPAPMMRPSAPPTMRPPAPPTMHPPAPMMMRPPASTMRLPAPTIAVVQQDDDDDTDISQPFTFNFGGGGDDDDAGGGGGDSFHFNFGGNNSTNMTDDDASPFTLFGFN